MGQTDCGDIDNMKPKMRLKTTPITFQGWDAASPADSFRAFAAHIHGQAKEVLLRDGNHSEMFFFMPLSGDGHIVLWRGDDRDLEAGWLRRHITEHYVYGMIHIVEAWMRMATGPGDHILKQIMAGEIKVSELQPEHRQEGLMTSAQSRDGWAVSWIDEILRVGGKPLLGTCTEFADFRGRFGKVFG